MYLYKKITPESEWPFMLPTYFNPQNDIAFKKIFGSEKNKDILIHFLNDILQFKAKKSIKHIEFLKTVQDPEIAAKKTSILDVLCKDEVGNSYIVEMQVAKEKNFIKRAQYYAAKAYGSQLKVKEKYHNLKKVIFLAITDFIMFPKKANYKSDHIILDCNSLEHDLKDFSFTFLELKKFNKPKEQLSTMIEKWCYFFKYAQETSDEDLIQIIGHDSIIKKAYDQLNKFNWNEKELNAYEASLKKEMDYDSAIEQSYDEGKSEGKKEIALAMLEKGLNINLIANLTKLTINEIKNLKNLLEKMVT